MFVNWMATALRGDVYEYARGNVSYSRWKRTRLLMADEAPDAELNLICDQAADAWRAFERGLVTLVQRRMGRDDFSYMAIRL